jgi:hypothetical protein
MTVEHPGILLVAVGVASALLVPRWVLIAAAIVLTRALPGHTLAGPLQLADLGLTIYLLRVVGGALTRRPFVLGHAGVVSWLAGFLGWAWFSLAVSDSWGTAWALGRITLYGVVFAAASSDDRTGPPLVRFVALYAATEAVLGLLGLPPRPGVRIFGLYGDPSQTGLLKIAGLAAAKTLRPPVRAPVFLLILAALVLSLTRSIWIASTISLAVWAWPRLRRTLTRIAAIAALGVALGWWLVPIATGRLQLNPQSISLRGQSWMLGINLFLDKPIVGHGWAVGATQLPPGTPPPFNLWINVAASTGFIGALLLTLFLAMALRQLVGAGGRLTAAWVPYLVGFLVVSLGEMTVWATGPSTIEFFTLTGAVLGTIRPPPEIDLSGEGASRPAPRARVDLAGRLPDS